jgi:hypothetical protein
VLEEVSHRQYVFTIPKRFRIFFKYDRKLLGKLAGVSWETVREVFVEEIDYEDVYPAIPDGVFLESGKFISIDSIPAEKFLERSQPAEK